jgi:RsiW-degrading membrane proteinase PrsW (M82 family)
MESRFIPGALAALLIAIVYLNFLRRMDVFEMENRKYTFIVFLLGVITTFLLIPLQIFLPLQRALPDEGGILTRFIYHFLAVGLYEELVKILPFLILLWFPKVMNESYDYVKYASVGALGFATVENVLYFNSSLYIIESRAFYTAILHMFTSSFIAYRFYFAKALGGKKLFWVVLISYLFVSAIHGLYNALMTGPMTGILGIFLVAVLLVVWGRMQNNLLNLSEFFSEDKIQNQVVMAGIRLLIGWALVFLYACGAIAFTENYDRAILFFSEGILFGVGSGLGLFLALARPRIVQGKWFPLLSRTSEGIRFISNLDVRNFENRAKIKEDDK